MKTFSKIVTVVTMIVALIINGCKKEDNSGIMPTKPTVSNESYSSVTDFLDKNRPQPVSYTINGTTGGSFTTAQGTIVTVPPNAFVNSGVAVTGNVVILFEDIYKKSDMLLANKATMDYIGHPLKSAGEFFIKATENVTALDLASGKKITVEQPAALTGGIDNAMTAFVNAGDTAGIGAGAALNMLWQPSAIDTLIFSTNYIFNLYSFSYPVSYGSWCNSDNSNYFAAYTQTHLTICNNDSSSFYAYVYLVFSGINSMVHVYSDGIHFGKFPYLYAPLGLQCTAVAFAVKDGHIYSSFTPITIAANMTVPFSFTQTTAAAFKAQLKALN